MPTFGNRNPVTKALCLAAKASIGATMEIYSIYYLKMREDVMQHHPLEQLMNENKAGYSPSSING